MSRQRIIDRANFFTVANAGATRRITPEGYLLCEGVAIGRTGTQLYTSKELQLPAGLPNVIQVKRLPEEVFSDTTLASFEGKSVTLNHPPGMHVNPENWQQLTVGTVQNVRRGQGTNDSLMLADLLITAADAIVYVNDNLPELSAGYEAEYEVTESGEVIQRDIIGNHVAIMMGNLRGRAGPRCAIKDEDTTVTIKDIWKRIQTAIATEDKAAVEAALAELNADPTAAIMEQVNVRLATTDSAIATLTAGMASLTEAITALKTAKPTVDAAPKYDATQLTDIQSRVEILVPGTRVPTADAATVEAVEAVIRTVITTAEAKHPSDVKAFVMGRDLKVLTGDDLRGVLAGVSEIVKLRNDNEQLRARKTTTDTKVPTTPTELNALYTDFWSKQSGTSAH